jgi:hypothetical protein
VSHYVNGAATPEFAQLMVTLAEARASKVTELQIRIYAKMLSDVPLDLLRVAFHRAANEISNSFFPSIGQIRRFIGPTEDDAALLAWSALSIAVEEAGSYMSVEVDDACAAVAIKSVFGGWPAFCATDDGPALALKRQEFLAAYRHARRGVAGAVGLPVRLPGLCEQSGHYARVPSVVVARITDGTLQIGREHKRLEGAIDGRAILPEAEARIPEAREGEVETT